MDLTIITGLASLFGCACMFCVCTAQVKTLLAASRPVAPQPWAIGFTRSADLYPMQGRFSAHHA